MKPPEIEELIVCDCTCAEHQMIFRYSRNPAETNPEWDFLCLDVHMCNRGSGFWKRLWAGLKYAFGYHSKYGDFDEVLLYDNQAEKLRDVCDRYLNRKNPVRNG